MKRVYKHKTTRFLDLVAPFYGLLLKIAGDSHARFREKCLNLANLTNNQRVLDIGCGTGELLLTITRRLKSNRIFGIDVSPNMIEIARQKTLLEDYGQVRLILGNCCSLPYKANCFDVVFSNIMFHHLDVEEKLQTVKETYRILKPGGNYISAEFGSRARIWLQKRFAHGEWTLDPAHFEQAGFKLLYQELSRAIWRKKIFFRVARKDEKNEGEN